MNSWYRIYRRKDHLGIYRARFYYFFELIAQNGQTLFTSHKYCSKQMAQKGIEAIRKYALNGKVEDMT